MLTLKGRVVLVAAMTLASIALVSHVHAAPTPTPQGDRGGRGSDGGGGEPGSGLPADYFFGLAHHAMGAATLTGDPAGNLVISNIGSSGQDGVSIDLSVASPPGGLTPGWSSEIDIGPAGGLAAGRTITVQARDQFGNAFATMGISETGGGHGALSFAQTLCPACPITVEMRLNGAVVQSTQFLPPYPQFLAMGNIGSQGNDSVEFVADRKHAFNNQFDVDLCVRLPAVQLLQLSGGLPPTDGDELRISLNGLPPGTRYIGNLVINSNGGPITVHGEALLAHELAHIVQQSAHMIGGGDLNGDGRPDIVVSNIGSSGQDGVTIKRFGIGVTQPEAALSGIGAECTWGAMGALPAGSTMRFTVGNDAPVPEFYTMLITGTASGAGAVSLERCAPCCPCAVTVQAIHNGQLVDQVTHDSPGGATLAVQNIGSQGSENSTLNAFHRYIVKSDGVIYDTLVIEIDNPAASSTTLTNSLAGPVTADCVRICIEPLDGTVGDITHATLRAGNVLVPFTLLDSTADPVSVDVQYAVGMPMSALGEATLTVNADGTMHVSGLDPIDPDDDGDGVSVDCGEVQGGAVGITFGSGLPTTSVVDVTYKAKAGKTGKTKFFDDDGDGDQDMRFSQNICPTCPISVDLLLDGQVVRSATYPPPYPSSLVENALSSSPSGTPHRFVWNSAADLGAASPPGAQLRVFSNQATLMTLSGQAPTDADCVRISLNGLPPGTPINDLASIDVTAAGVPDFTLSSAIMTVNDRSVARQGLAARLAPRLRTKSIGGNHCVRVSNIGSSGQDGVACGGEDEDCDGAADDDEERQASIVPVTISGAATLTISGTMSLSIAGETLPPISMQMRAAGGGGGNNINWFFGGSTTLSHRAQVVLGGAVVLEASGVTGPLAASVPGSAVVVGGGVSRVLNGMPLVWSPRSNIRFQSPVMITLSTGLSAMGDELRIIGENPTSPPTGVRVLRLIGGNLPGNAITLMDLTGTPLDTCPADVTGGDDAVTVLDLLAVINTWGACPQPCPPQCSADIVDDCSVNVLDLLAVINGWGACQ